MANFIRSTWIEFYLKERIWISYSQPLLWPLLNIQNSLVLAYFRFLFLFSSFFLFFFSRFYKSCFENKINCIIYSNVRIQNTIRQVKREKNWYDGCLYKRVYLCLFVCVWVCVCYSESVRQNVCVCGCVIVLYTCVYVCCMYVNVRGIFFGPSCVMWYVEL